MIRVSLLSLILCVCVCVVGVVCIPFLFSFSVLGYCMMSTASRKRARRCVPMLAPTGPAVSAPRAEEEASLVSMTTMCPSGSYSQLKTFWEMGEGPFLREISPHFSSFQRNLLNCVSLLLCFYRMLLPKSHAPKLDFIN